MREYQPQRKKANEAPCNWDELKQDLFQLIAVVGILLFTIWFLVHIVFHIP